MIERLNHSDRAAPTTQFSQATIVPAGARMLITSGQVGVGADGKLAESIEEQVEITWKNILQLLEEAGTTSDHIVKATTYLTSQAYIDAYREIRNRIVPRVKACSTLVIVPALADPGFLVEVEVIAEIPETA